MFLGQSAVSGQSVFRVRNWERFGSKGKGGRRSTGRMPAALLGTVCGLQALVRKRLLNLPGGAAAYGVWILLSAIVAETCVPGVFLDEDRTPLTVDDLVLLTDVRREELQSALDTLASPEVRLIETVSLEEVLKTNPVSENNPGSGVRVSGFAGSSELPEQDRFPSKPEIRTHRPLAESTDAMAKGADLKVELDAASIPDNKHFSPHLDQQEFPEGAGDAALERLGDVVAQTRGNHPHEGDGGDQTRDSVEPLNKLEQQMAQLAGVCQQIDQMKRHVAAMTNSTPILTASRKGRPNGWKVNATLNPGKK